jgi:hypothetical protein
MKNQSSEFTLKGVSQTLGAAFKSFTATVARVFTLEQQPVPLRVRVPVSRDRHGLHGQHRIGRRSGR